MLNRQNEAKTAIEFAEKVEEAYSKKESILEILQKYRADDLLAVAPSEAENVDQIYADMIAEYYVRSSKEELVSQEDLEQMDSNARSAFESLLTEEYKEHRRGVYETHMALTRFRKAIRAYALLKPGGKGNEDAVPDEASIRKVMEEIGKKPLALTLDVFSHQNSPLERYARARSKLMPEGPLLKTADYEAEWRIPEKICREASCPEEVVLLAILYHRYKPQKVEKYTDYYPVSIRDVGIYMTDKNQGKPFDKVKNPVYLKIYRQPFPGNSPQTMVALKQEAVEAFVSCYKEKGAEAYLKVSEGKPRAVLHAIEEFVSKKASDKDLYETYMKTPFDTGSEAWKTWIEKNGENVRQRLLEKLRIECSARDLRGEVSKRKMSLPKKSSKKWVFKLMLCAHWISLDEENRKGKQEIGYANLEGLLLKEEVEEVFGLLEKTKWEVLNAGSVWEGELSGQTISQTGYLAFDVEGFTFDERKFAYAVVRDGENVPDVKFPREKSRENPSEPMDASVTA